MKMEIREAGRQSRVYQSSIYCLRGDRLKGKYSMPCGHCCVAMLAGVPLADVVKLMGKTHASWSKILEALDYYGISHAAKAVYPKGSSYQLPECCIVGNANRFLLWYQGAFCGVTNVDQKKNVSYIEVYAE